MKMMALMMMCCCLCQLGWSEYEAGGGEAPVGAAERAGLIKALAHPSDRTRAVQRALRDDAQVGQWLGSWLSLTGYRRELYRDMGDPGMIILHTCNKRMVLAIMTTIKCGKGWV
jgi:hypothetical protein